MSSLNAFNILKIGEDFIEVKVTMVHPDEHHINDSANFALQIILEQFENIKNQSIYNSGWSFYPLNQEQANKLIEHDKRLLLDELLLKMRWRKVPMTDSEYNNLVAQNNFVFNGQKLSSIGSENGEFYGLLETEYDAFCEEADNRIISVEVLSTENFPFWFDSLEAWLEYGHISWGFDDETYDKYQNTPDPSYLLKIRIAENSLFLLKHLIEGSFWESASYNFNNYTQNFEDAKSALYHCLQYSSDVEIPNDDMLKAYWNSLSNEWKKVLLLNLYLQKKHPYTNLKEKYQGMMTIGVFEDRNGKFLLEELFAKEVTSEDLQNIAKMKMLFASNCNLTELSALKMLKGLKLLELEANPLKSIEELQLLTDLEDLTIIIYNDRPSQLSIANLSKMRDLTFDPNNQSELNALLNMPKLRTFYGIMDFSPDFSVFENLKHLTKLVGYSTYLSDENMIILQKLRERGMSISWETENGEL